MLDKPHRCPEWDFMLIRPGDPEMEACICDGPGTDIYREYIAHCSDDPKQFRLARLVWDGTPWMVDTYTGSKAESIRYSRMRKWCVDHFGPESWPIHGKPAGWHTGGATVNGWTWMGFATEEMMEWFKMHWVDR